MDECKSCKELKKKFRNVESQLIALGSILDWIEIILDGDEVSDFALSFPIVRRVWDMMNSKE